MEYLLNPRNVRILESFCLVKTLFAFDYDGTLAPITDDPKKAVMKKNVAILLQELNKLSKIAVITGRKSADVKALLPIDPYIVIGNHGAEGSHTTEDLERMVACCRQWLDSLKDLFPVMDQLGIRIENKDLSLSFHFRGVTDPEVAEKALEMMLSRLKGAKISKGKCVINVIPEFSVDKGKALDLVMKENNFHFGVYFGDDYTDEDVFRYKNSRLLTVKIGEEESLAKYYLKSQEEMEKVLGLVKSYMLKVRAPSF